MFIFSGLLGGFDPIHIINKWSQVAEQHKQQQEDAQQDSVLYTYYTDKNRALPTTTFLFQVLMGCGAMLQLWGIHAGPNRFPGALSGCQVGRAPVGPAVVKCHLIITITIVITIVVMCASAALE